MLYSIFLVNLLGGERIPALPTAWSLFLRRALILPLFSSAFAEMPFFPRPGLYRAAGLHILRRSEPESPVLFTLALIESLFYKDLKHAPRAPSGAWTGGFRRGIARFKGCRKKFLPLLP